MTDLPDQSSRKRSRSLAPKDNEEEKDDAPGSSSSSDYRPPKRIASVHFSSTHLETIHTFEAATNQPYSTIRPLPVASLQMKSPAALAASIAPPSARKYPTASSIAHSHPIYSSTPSSPPQPRYGTEEARVILHAEVTDRTINLEVDDEALCADIDRDFDDVRQALVRFAAVKQHQDLERRTRRAFVQKPVRVRKRTEFVVQQATIQKDAVMAGEVPPSRRMMKDKVKGEKVGNSHCLT